MQNEFKFKIKNFGPIDEANLNLNKLNVIGGVNASGKSFSARLLFCIITALSDEGKRIDNESVKSLFTDFINRYGLNFSVISSDVVKSEKSDLTNKLNNLLNSWKEYDVSYEFLDNFYKNFGVILDEFDFSDENFDKDFKKIRPVIDSHSNELQYIISVLRFLLMAEFGADQVPNFDGANVNISASKLDCKMEYDMLFTSESLTINMNSNQLICRDFTNVIYMDSMSAMDFQLTGQNIHYHYISLLNYLMHTKPMNSNGVYNNVEEVMDISKQFNGMLNGTFKFNPLNNIFSFESDGKSYDVKNIASGYKQIGVLQRLLNNNQISGKTLLILDEPETNLHPSFQIQLANIIVQMVKELDLMVYINSHSPFVIEAVEVYSKKEGIEKDTNFYMCESINVENTNFNIHSIDRDDLKILYDNLSDPFRLINNIRFENELNDLD